MTGFGVYLIILYVVGIMASLFSACRGGQTTTPGVLIISAIWSAFNVLGILFIGTGLGI